MTNQLIKNETKVFYTVKIKEGLYVKRSEFFGPDTIKDLKVTTDREESYVYDNQKTAMKVALYAEGKIIKHTRTQVITEITEEIEVIKEEMNNGK
ncbi:hypothetical protein [Virgibacillus sp. Bac332]|uniref:hypothetical protein n=1 Tax=Virgibacillus sp. Bac332 TaxID=2419842 RepID=UPI000EF53D46|nr:hypothetical protein [Virgibacillus sp. Bac332]